MNTASEFKQDTSFSTPDGAAVLDREYTTEELLQKLVDYNAAKEADGMVVLFSLDDLRRVLEGHNYELIQPVVIAAEAA